MMTSRAEYRLMLRQDNADLRLTEKGYNVGLVSEDRYKKYLSKKEEIQKELERVRKVVVKPTDENNEVLKSLGSTPIERGTHLSDLIKRTELNYSNLENLDKERPQLPIYVTQQVETEIKYEGYIKLQKEQIERFKKLEEKKLSEDLDYLNMSGLSLEARQKLNNIKPANVGQASRISGVSPADISVLLIHISQNKGVK